MIIKFALRNLVRVPWRTLLYGLIVFFIMMAMTASLFVWRACMTAEKALQENYIFVASLIKRENGTFIPLSEIFKCVDYENIRAFNITMSEGDGVIPGGKAMTELPSTDHKGVASSVWIEEFGCDLYAVENLALAYPFFSGECTIREGTALTEKGYHGEIDEIVIPWWLSEKYDIEVGDTINRRYYKQTGAIEYIYIPTVVVGIYESSSKSLQIKDYPVYIPLAVAELDYGKVYGSYLSLEDIKVERADFILKNRHDFEHFIAYASARETDFTSANIVFNNSTYDVLLAELENVNTIALLVCGIVFFVGVGVLVFVTVYLCKSREKERVLLSALGMTKMSISVMIATELTILILCAAFLGFFAGNSAADGVCTFVNDTVLARASASEEIQNLNSASEFEITMPLEKNMQIELSVSEPRIRTVNVELNEMKTLSENEIGISRHTFYVSMTGTESEQYFSYGSEATDEERQMIETREKTAVEIVGVTDLSVFDLTVTGKVLENMIALYVSENSPYASENSIVLTEGNIGDYISVHLHDAQITESGITSAKLRYIAGTYRDNEYCSGNDILVSMEDYHKLYADESITEPENCFQRIGAIYQTEAK